MYAEPIKAELITARLEEIRAAGVTVAGSLSPQRTKEFAKAVVDAGVDMFVIRGTTVSAEHVSSQSEPLNLKEFIYELDVPVIVGGCATYQASLHLMRTGAAGVLVGFGGGAAHTTRTVLGVAVPMASAVADVAAARRDYLDESGGRYVHVIADGSIGRSGDIAKAIACGADAVMVGSPFARATDAPGHGFHWGTEAHHAELPAWRAGRVRHGRHPRGDPLRALPRRRRHDEPDRGPAPLDGDDRLHRAQGVPAGRGRRRVSALDSPLEHPVVVIYTDGACIPNPGPGGWGAVLRQGSHELDLCGGDAGETTNNRMELTAPIKALELLKRASVVEIHTDSTYVRNGITKWVAGWSSNGWRTSAKQPVKNVDLWQQLVAACERHEVEWHWVKGHAGQVDNERADRLAAQGLEEAVEAARAGLTH